VQHDPIAAAYEFGLETARIPRDDERHRERFERMMGMSPEERRAATRGFRDGVPATAPLPLAFELAHHAIWIALVSEAEERGGRWNHFAVLAPVLYGYSRLWMDASNRAGRARARAAGIERQGDAPRVPRVYTNLWLGVMTVVRVLQRLAGHRPRKRSLYEMNAPSAANALVAWWAWRPYLSRSRRRAAPPA
jgi:hypothetical protein